MDYFDELPLFLEDPCEPIFVNMVRLLLQHPSGAMLHANFGRHFPGTKKFMLLPFFDFKSGPSATISLRFLPRDTGDSDAEACALRHWELRRTMQCKAGHSLTKIEVLPYRPSLCFACNYTLCDVGSYRCAAADACVGFQICSACMLFSANDPRAPKKTMPSDPVPAVKKRKVVAAVHGSVGIALNLLPGPRRPLLILLRGHVLRVGNRLSDNASGDLADLRSVLSSIQRYVLKLSALTDYYDPTLFIDVVYTDSTLESQTQLSKDVLASLRPHRERISAKALGVCQTDTLLASLAWIKDGSPSFPGTNVGLLILRADCLLKQPLQPARWIEPALTSNRVMFPFMVNSAGGPADQILFVPADLLGKFTESLKYLISFDKTALQRQSLHFMHTKHCLGGRLEYVVPIICNANTIHEWNPFYQILGRPAKNRNYDKMTAWGWAWLPDGSKTTSSSSSPSPAPQYRCHMFVLLCCYSTFTYLLRSFPTRSCLRPHTLFLVCLPPTCTVC